MKILATNLTLEAKEILSNSKISIIDTIVNPDNLIDFIEDNYIEGIVFDELEDFNSDIIESCPTIKLIAFKNEIEDNSDIQFAKDQGIHVISVSEAIATSKAELAFAHLMGMARFLHQSNREMPLEGDVNFENLQNTFIGTELKGKTVGIIGMNATGKELARIAIGLGMKPIVTDHEPKNMFIPIEFFDGQSMEFQIAFSAFDDVISKSDFIILNAKSNGAYIMDEAHFDKVKRGVGIINISQGAIDEVALINAIGDGKVTFAGLDAFEKQPQPEIQLLMKPELSLSPAISSQTYETQLRISEELANSIVEVLEI